MTKFTIASLGPSSIDKVHSLYEDHAEDWRRDHLGASIAGHRCDRYLWLSFRWAKAPSHDGRQLRLFERGKREEQWIIRDLRRAGFIVFDRDPTTIPKRQFTVRWGHVGGSIDGLIEGLLEAPATVHVLEVKTFNAKQFAYLKEKGVRSAKREHWVQMQLYMLGRKLERAFYIGVCKDTDELYAERVTFDREAAESALARAQTIVEDDAPPDRLDPEQPPCVLVSKDGTRWPCQFYDLCHGNARPERNCRTCVHSTPIVHDDGSPAWTCAARGGREVSSKTQRKGCGRQRTIPPIVNAQLSYGPNDSMFYQFGNGDIYQEG